MGRPCGLQLPIGVENAEPGSSPRCTEIGDEGMDPSYSAENSD